MTLHHYLARLRRRLFTGFLRSWQRPIRRQAAARARVLPRLEGLEERLAPASYLVTPQLQVLRTDNAGGDVGRQVVFFESGVKDFQLLRQGLACDTDAVVLNGGGDGLAEMGAFLKGRQGLSAIHVVSHGAPGVLELGTTVLDQQALKDHTAQVTAMGAALAPHGDLLLWGCDVAAGPEGQTFLSDLAGTMGANVAAAAHLVGAADLGGSWQLETTLGDVHTEAPFSAEAREAFHTVLPFSPTASMSTARDSHTATLLANGKVLVAGGYNGSSSVSTAELYDPVANTWSGAGSLSVARQLHTATLLANGKVLVAGGHSSSGLSLSSAELYDPATNTWSVAGALSTAREVPHGDAAGQRQGSRHGGIRQQWLSVQRGVVRPRHEHLDRRRRHERRAVGPHGDVAGQWQGARHGRRKQRHRSVQARSCTTPARTPGPPPAP
jgi:hypothetical protein